MKGLNLSTKIALVVLLLFFTGMTITITGCQGSDSSNSGPISHQTAVLKETVMPTNVTTSDIKDFPFPDPIKEEMYEKFPPEDRIILKQAKKRWVYRSKKDGNETLTTLSHFIKRGDTIADIGCGAGYFVYGLSELVGNKGKVYAIDISLIAYVSQGLVRREMAIKYGEDKFINIVPILNDRNKLYLPENNIDLAFVCGVHIFHIDMGYPPILSTEAKYKQLGQKKHQSQLKNKVHSIQKEFISSIRNSLKPGGRLVILEGMVLSPHLKLNKKNVIEILLAEGFELEKDITERPQHHFLVFKKK
ncbi:MAG: methyltransferase domain-containing protein [Candidatus Eremiobacteraeota bacterium]|nr:methyltransferase domain-containing protein [Candidatus Eremiobacteraeota bacterium]